MTHEELRQAVFERDNYICQYCGRCGAGVDLEIDHIIPVSKGGKTDMRNLITACRACNRAKRNRLLTVAELQEIADKINTSLDYLMSLCAPATPPQYTASDKQTTRISFLLDTEIYRVLAVLSALEDKTMTEILTAGAQLYIQEHSREAEIARGAIAQVKKN